MLRTVNSYCCNHYNTELMLKLFLNVQKSMFRKQNNCNISNQAYHSWAFDIYKYKIWPEKYGQSNILRWQNVVSAFPSIMFFFPIFSHIRCKGEERMGRTLSLIFFFFSNCCMLHLISTQVAWENVFIVLVWWSSRPKLFHTLKVFSEL